ncbi:MAG: cadherin repeat domain-containing protein [Chloroflexi bacterium]|nr:cadherin repeat domain-containing protein [Chloroflexota bacterium]
MHTLNLRTGQLKIYGGILAIVALVVAALVQTLTSGAQAQSPPNPYGDPRPCGLGPDTREFEMPEPHEKTSGHYALFDAYWEKTEPDQAETPGLGDEQANTGLLHTNECPPLVTNTTETQGLDTVAVTKLTESRVDIDELIVHVEDSRQVTVVQGDPDDLSTHHLRLDQYEEVGDYVDAGDRVWWLRLDDPDLGGDQKSDLALGFSTKRFDEKYWTGVHYEFRLERNPGIDPGEHPHLLAYRARQTSLPGAKLVWNSAKVGVTPVVIAPGVLIDDLQWVFTKAGTYEIYVQPVGYVRQHNPHKRDEEGYDVNWKAISANATEPGEVKKYVIHVGPLAEVEPPQFGVIRSVPENSAAGTNVGDPVLAFSEASDLEYSLSGDGHENFAVASTTEADPYSVQIKVAEGSSLDYETEATYDLTLGVTNKIDHESNPDSTIDDTLLVRIALEDVPTSAVIQADKLNPVVGETVTLTATVTDFGEGYEVIYHFVDSESISAGSASHTIQRTIPTTETVEFYATYVIPDGTENAPIHRLDAAPVTVTWRSQ